MSSYLRINDEIQINKINPYTLPGMFTPGVPTGGSYKNVFTGKAGIPLVNAVEPVNDALGGKIDHQVVEPSPGCVNTTAAGWKTPEFCQNKKLVLDRPMYPMRIYHNSPWEMHDRNMRNNIPGREGLFGFPLSNQLTGTASILLLAMAVGVFFIKVPNK